MAAATTLAWIGSIVVDGRGRRGDERSNGETKLATDSNSILRVIYTLSYKRFYGLQIILQYLEFLVRRRSVSIVRRTIIPRVGRSSRGLLTV
jgi:hypothetical protein